MKLRPALPIVAATLVIALSSHALADPGAPLTGRVLDARSGEPLSDARVRILAPAMETATGRGGEFLFSNVAPGTYELEASRLGFAPERRSVSLGADTVSVEFRLEPKPVPVPPVEVTTTRATERGSAVAFTDLDRKTIQEHYWAQDVPMLLAETPSVYAYSDAGNGIGYSYVKIRGFPQRRVAVTINGIPLNDPETHEVYWVDHPDLVSSAQSLQVQRGVGSALYGASAVGGSVNLETVAIPTERRLSIQTGVGSYDTRRFSMDYQSGLLDGTYALSGRYSRIISQGYRDLSWSRLWSYYLSAARIDSWITSRLNLYGGPEQLHLAFYGVDRPYLDGAITGDAGKDRRINPLNWRNETDNFFEPHYELIQDVKLGERVALTSSAFYFPGKGYYDDFPYGPQSFSSRRLPSFEVDSDSLYPAGYYAVDSTGAPAMQPDGRFLVIGSDMTQRLWVRNRHYGWIPRARYSHGKGELTVGAEWREHEGRHWGELTWAQALPLGTDPNHVFYDYAGRVRALSGFVQEGYLLRPDLKLTGSLQWRQTRYAIGKDRYSGYDFHLTYSFLSPRIGLNWNATERWNVFGNYAHTQTEPILSEIYRADDPTAVPLFRVVDVAAHVYRDPLIDPEHLNDYEAGLGYRNGNSYLRLTGFRLDFRNEIVANGQIDALGVPITGNAARSVHQGVELEGGWAHASGFEVSGNVSLSRNRFRDYREFVDSTTVNDFGGNTIAGFPSRLANLTVGYRHRRARAALTLNEAGRQYLDNSEDNRKNPALQSAPGYQKKLIEEHATWNGLLSFDLGGTGGFGPLGARRLSLELRGMNLTDLRYETAGYVYAEVPYFYPAATRSVFASLKADF
ncbi:MAG: TonB-dependent receptor [Candidatus Eisenbacteria bacterium]|uniref:TonB-dependent receptor n=1 Tax=Eiseniibacteriota bacterium TaxID=2212470 RepID=A0A538T423_UNCEI|nr:MAG: TonB-dependent receptor [Candidatus Eisenbacteria bacterium]